MTDSKINAVLKPATLVFKNVSKKFNSFYAVNNINLAVEAGELITLLGPSGCGKTTTLRLIAGLEKVTNGQIFLDNIDITNKSAAERDISMVFQSYALFPHMKVDENIGYGLKMAGKKKQEIKIRIQETIALVGLEGLAKRYPNELSGGQQQRVAVARGLVLKPRILLFDEPLSNLDVRLRRKVREDIREIQQRLKITVVYVTHDQEEALAVSDRIIVMNNAEITQTGTPHELYDQPNSEFIADFIGESNLLNSKIISVNNNIALVSVNKVVLNLHANGNDVGDAKLAIHPNRILISKQQTTNSLKGMIAKVSFIGSSMEYLVKTVIGELFVTDNNIQDIYAVNENVYIHFQESNSILLPPK